MPSPPVGVVVFAQRRANAAHAGLAMLLQLHGLATEVLDLVATEDEHEDVESFASRIIASVDHIRATGLHRRSWLRARAGWLSSTGMTNVLTGSVLVVDDNAQNRALARATLEDALQLSADPALARRILENLINNAIRHAPGLGDPGDRQARWRGRRDPYRGRGDRHPRRAA